MSQPLTLLRGADVYAPAPLGRVDVLVAGGRIAAIAPSLPDPPAGWPAEVVDLSGKALVPGLVDLHTHLCGGGGEGGPHARVPAVQLTELSRAGVTTAVGLLGTDGTTRSLAELLAATRGLCQYGITALCYTGSYEVPPPTLTGSIRGDIVHIAHMVAVGEVAISDHRSSQPTFDELVRLAADAHVAGLMTGKAGLLHLHLGDGARGLSLVRRALDETELPARTFHPTHCNRNHRLWAEAMALSSRGITLDVTAFPPDDQGPSAEEAVAQYLASGLDPARITLSSDGGGCLPDFDGDGNLVRMDVGASASLMDAVRALVAGGLPLGDAIRPCTDNAARLFRLHKKGRIEAGLDADLVVLDGDLRVEATMAGGAWMVRGGEAVVRGVFEVRGR